MTTVQTSSLPIILTNKQKKKSSRLLLVKAQFSKAHCDVNSLSEFLYIMELQMKTFSKVDHVMALSREILAWIAHTCRDII